ncbi:Fe-S cluster assembly sulfur transfer protein SufU [Haliangium ochraceum]|uniref:SUF system FeS assembly protein, NifU family n=1 Tax=Haliangium ochraceum (strain DSM 14365 / JCM 11303 / SMP-2) TaxID=502025 RepID=D0LTT8_HALO1|nr:SUF system NifU family Fe-S cluster assembly protein [Haliangium ochraceum]ACY15782.1 SUF system FeS assembly protein, NifU family [Haliangium ochraceum DSM 14365]
MSDLRELYQEVILDHSKSPRNNHLPADADCRADGHNPLCGDRITLGVRLDGEVIGDVGFEGNGCAISVAAASTMTEAIKGSTTVEAKALFQRFHQLVTGKEQEPDLDVLGKLAVFAGVAEFPMRVKCATLCWHTLEAALSGQNDQITTE